MDERVKFIARLLDGEAMSRLCEEFEISRKIGYKMALSREPQRECNLIEMRGHSSAGGCTLPLLGRLGSENAQRTTGDEVALEVERIVDGGVGGEEALG